MDREFSKKPTSMKLPGTRDGIVTHDAAEKVHETVEAPVCIHYVGSGAQHKVESIAEHDLCAEAFEFLGRHRLHGTVGTHWHERGRLYHTMRECQATKTSCAVSSQQFELGPQPGALGFVKNIASP